MKFATHNTAAQGKFSLREVSNDEGYSLRVIPEGKVSLQKIEAVFEFLFEKDDALFLNGYQSWTYSPERSVDEYDKSMKHCPKFADKMFAFSRYGDGFFYPPRYQKGVLHGYSYAYVRRGDTYFLFASLRENSGFTRIVFNTNKNEIRLEKDCEGRVINSEYPALDFLFLKGEENEVFDAYFKALGIKCLPAEKATGYTSWYNCYQDISAARIESDLEGLKTLPARPDVFQIDDGFEQYVGDWLEVDPKKFPDGTKPIAEKILAEGYKAGIWLAPFVCEKNSRLFKEHPEYLLKDKDGAPLCCGSNWSGAFALDFYNQNLREYIRQCVETYKEQGFSLFKLDFLYAVCMNPRPDKTRGEIMEEAMAFLRDVCGDSQILACGVPLAPAFGKAEYCRIGPDVSLSYDDKAFMRLFHAERPSTRHTMMNTVFRRQLSHRAFLNDPDVFILRDDNTSLSPSQKTALATVNALFGGVLFASDEFQKYDAKKKEEYRRIISLKNAENVKVERKEKHFTLSYRLNGETHTFEFDHR